MNRVFLMNPPMDIQKLNFDGNFAHSIRRGGIGAVIRDWSDTAF